LLKNLITIKGKVIVGTTVPQWEPKPMLDCIPATEKPRSLTGHIVTMGTKAITLPVFSGYQ
jgi:hypothetical protein